MFVILDRDDFGFCSCPINTTHPYAKIHCISTLKIHPDVFKKTSRTFLKIIEVFFKNVRGVFLESFIR